MGKDGYGVAKAKNSGNNDALSQAGRDVLSSLQKAGNDLLRSAESALSTSTGKKVLEKIAEYVQESEAVNTAMATRIYDLLDREVRFRERLTAVEKQYASLRNWLLVSAVFSATCLAICLYLLLKRL
jgi:hypothetical protein